MTRSERLNITVSVRMARHLPELDAMVWFLAPLLGVAIATPDIANPNWWALLGSGVASAASVLGVNSLRGAYRPSSEDAAHLDHRAKWPAHVAGLLVLLASLTATTVGSPVTVAIAGSLGSAAASTIIHNYARSRRGERRAMATGLADPTSIVLLGAGSFAHEIAGELAATPAPRFEVVGLLDDNLATHNRTIAGARVEGTSGDVVGVARRCGATAVLLAVRSLPSGLVREIVTLCAGSGIEVLVFPSIGEVPAGSPVSIDHIRPATDADCLARRSSNVNLVEHAAFIAGECVAITGAAGELGAELTRRVAELGPRRLVLIDVDEPGLGSIGSSVPVGALRTVCVDVADSAAIEAVFRHEKPLTVFHCASATDAIALENDPRLAVSTNIVGTQALLDAAAKVGTTTFVHVSSADAAAPSDVFGYSKHIAEGLVAAAAGDDRRYVSVRMGTVVGVRNTMLRAIQTQIELGEPVTLAHPRADRYCITASEAVDLTIAGGSIARAGEVVLLEVGEPVRDLDITVYFSKRAGRPVPIEFRGLAPGESVHRGLRGTAEIATADDTGLVWYTAVPEIGPEVARSLAAIGDPADLIAAMAGFSARGDSGTELSILLSPPEVSSAERQSLLRAFDSGWIAPAGPELSAFEAELCTFTGAEAAVALGSGSAALHLALVLNGVGPGDEVIVQNATFAATAFAVTYTGATPVFCDIDAATMTLDPALLAEILGVKADEGRLPKAVMAVDIYGMVADYTALRRICDAYDIPLIQDAAESLGSSAQGRMAGCHGDLGAVSFNGNKIITTSGGGALLGPADLISHARKLSTQAREPVLHYEHADIGFNYRMSNILAALGRTQLGRLDAFVEQRNQIARRYADGLADLEGLDWFPLGVTDRANRWLNVALLPESVDAKATCTALAESGIEARPAWYPMDRQPVFAGHEAHRTGVADELFARGICLPSGSGLVEAEQDFVIGRLRKAIDSLRHARAAA